jgi:hypothetical protein
MPDFESLNRCKACCTRAGNPDNKPRGLGEDDNKHASGQASTSAQQQNRDHQHDPDASSVRRGRDGCQCTLTAGC